MKNRILMLLQRVLFLIVLASSLFQLGYSETSPYCRPAICTVTCSTGLYDGPKWVSSSIDNLIDGSSYKAIVWLDHTSASPAPGYPAYSRWFKIDQGAPRLVVTVYLLEFAFEIWH